MGDIQQYDRQVSPQIPKGVSPFTLIGGFHPPDNQVATAVAGGLNELGGRIADITLKVQAANQNEEVARARADYFSKMSDWVNTVDQQNLDPTEYRAEFD